MYIPEMISLQATLFCLIFTGILIKKLGILTEPGVKCLSDLLIYILLPCSILHAFLNSTDLITTLAQNGIDAVCLSAAIQVAAIIIGKLAFRSISEKERINMSYGMICSNSSSIGIPIASALFGQSGIMYASIFQIPIRLTMWSVGLSLYTGMQGKSSPKKALLHPCILAVVFGVLYLFLPIPVPYFLKKAINLAGSGTTAISMVVVGAIMGDIPIRSCFHPHVLFYCVLRLAVFPILVWLVILNIQLEPVVFNTCILMTAMPAGSTTAILAKKYGCNPAFASELIFASTLFSLLSLPLFSLLLR